MDGNTSELKKCLETRAPILYIGAGFTYNSQNKSKNNVELGAGLCRLLFDEFWNNSLINSSISKYKKTAETYVNEKNLKKLCSLLKLLNLSKERNEFLKEYFSGCGVSFNDSRNYLCDYPWTKIFTVNIDDLIENIYYSHGKELNIWNRDNDDLQHYPNKPTLIKLHGCVRNIDKGVVFDEDEYISFLSSEDYMLNEFGDAFSKNDIIFIGTEFQEEDLKSIVNKFSKMGYNSINNYFFVTPSINDEITKLQIATQDNLFHVEMKAIDFFDFLKKEINISNERKNKLIEYGMIDLYERFKNVPSIYNSKLYHGEDITYGDLRDSWDIVETNSNLIDWIQADKHNKIISIFGADYVGKTCIAKRILYDLFNLSYDCYEFKLNSPDKIDLFLDYVFDNYENNRHCAVLFEGAAYLYELLVDRIVHDNPYNNRIIIITTDSIVNHEKKFHALEKNKYCKSIMVTEHVNADRAELIYNKLLSKNSLNRLYDIGDDKETIKKFMEENNDIIDILYFSSLGRSFQEHIKHYILSDLVDIKDYNTYISLLCILSKIGINDVPSSLYTKIAKVINPSFSRTDFEKDFSKVIQISREYYHLRYTRILTDKFFTIVGADELKRVWIVMIKHYVGRFNEGTYNEYSTFLYKILNFKSLNIFFSLKELKDLYSSIENDCKQYSYYWVQRGICAQKQKRPDYEEADRFLREARVLRPNSYQVTHAIAKNLIERGLDNLKANPEDNILFNNGIVEMKALIENKRYSRALGYSLHSFIYSVLKYSKITGKLIDTDDCMFINTHIVELEDNDINQMFCKLLIELKKYAKENNLNKVLRNVTGRVWNSSNYKDVLQYEYIENDWNI